MIQNVDCFKTSIIITSNIIMLKTSKQNIEYHNVEIIRRRILKNFDCYRTLNDKEQSKIINLKISIFRWCILYAIQKGNNPFSNPYIFATIHQHIERNLLEKSVKRPFCCTVFILQVYFTYLCYITCWALAYHFIENLKLLLKENQIMK